MAPATQTSLLDHILRQRQTTDVPTCVTTCMAEGNTTGCTGVTDYTCVCASTAYTASVATCWASSCNATEAAIGESYSTQACAYYGVDVNSTTTTTTSSASTTATGSTVTESTAATDSAPVIYNAAFKNIQAAMSSICAALILLALVLGFMSCRNRYKREQAASQNRTWTGVGSHSLANSKDAKSTTSRFFTRTGNSSAFTNSRNQPTQTETFMSDNFGITSSNYGGNSVNRDRESFGYGGGAGAGGTGARFTNRMTLGELGTANESEEWEMDDTKRSVNRGSRSLPAPLQSLEHEGEGEGGSDIESDKEKLEDLESPKSAMTFDTRSTGTGVDGTMYEVEGSTVHLNALEKGDGSRAL